jgi:hypothetical protein
MHIEEIVYSMMWLIKPKNITTISTIQIIIPKVMSVGERQNTSGVYDANLQYSYNDILIYG